MIVWLIGLSGSGKTTTGRELYRRLKPAYGNLVYVDGDEFREIFCDDVDHTIEGRRKNAERISRFCRVLDAQGIHVIASVLSVFPEWQAWNRAEFSSYFEVFLDIPIKRLELRDPKGLYAAARSGKMPNVVGYDIPFPRPSSPDLVITEEDQDAGADACVDRILTFLSMENN